jgi:hypothetical protein
MDASRFDAVARSVAAASRRQVLAAFADAMLASLHRSAAVAKRGCETTADCPRCQYCRALEGSGRCHKCGGKKNGLTCENTVLCRPTERCPGEPCTQLTGECCAGVCNGVGRCVFGGCPHEPCSDDAQCCLGSVCRISDGACVPAS